MKQFVGILVFVAAWVGSGCSQHTSTNPQPVFVIHGPTIVAFFAPVTAKDLDNDEDTNEALSDFQFYNGKVGGPLHKAGIEFYEADARSFKVRIGTTVRIYGTSKAGVGYYFIAPGKEPHIESGVMTDEDLLGAARKYFRLAIR
jgi:hypothetical protein